VIFINNAIYGMTGGQMAPTTLMGQQTATSPDGRSLFNGLPMRMAELIAGLDGPIYVERVALFDAKNRRLAKKAIKKAVQNQVENRGYSFVEVLSECPTHLKMSPEETEKWVKECMVPIFPLGVKKDLHPEPWFIKAEPSFDPAKMLKVIGASSEAPVRNCESFPAHINPLDISLKLAGSGGDGAQTAAMLIAKAAINEGFDATHIPSYGPESRGGTSYADVHVAKDEVLNPASPQPDVLIAFNAPSLSKFGPTVKKGGTIIYDSSIVKDVPAGLDPSVKLVGVPFTEIAVDLGKAVVKNIVALGALQAATGIFPKETLMTAVRQMLKDKCALIPLNEQAYAWGIKAAEELAK
jgi:2-oxoisovalerate ferredoxin oxidoreductase beta subunit